MISQDGPNCQVGCTAVFSQSLTGVRRSPVTSWRMTDPPAPTRSSRTSASFFAGGDRSCRRPRTPPRDGPRTGPRSRAPLWPHRSRPVIEFGHEFAGSCLRGAGQRRPAGMGSGADSDPCTGQEMDGQLNSADSSASTRQGSEMELTDMSWPAVAALRRDVPVVLPIAALEQHGRHLPVFTDSLLLGEVLRA